MKKKKLKNVGFTAVFIPDEKTGGYSAYVEEIPGVNTQGDTLEEARENLLDALELMIEIRRELMEKELPANQNIIRESLVTVG